LWKLLFKQALKNVIAAADCLAGQVPQAKRSEQP